MNQGQEPAFAHRLPPPALRPYVDGYHGYRMGPLPTGVHRGLPSRHLTMIVSIGEPIDVLAHTNPAQAPAAYGFALGGLQLTPAQIAADGPQEGVAIALTPLGCRAVLGMPAMALWNATVEAEAVLGRLASELRARLHEAPGWAARFAICDELLVRATAGRRGLADERLRGAWQLMVSSAGNLAVGELADRVGWSRRHLTGRFQAEFGLTPKAASRVLRFERACALLRSRPRRTLAEIAIAAGYCDQPHLNREFAALLGCPPLAWIAAEFPYVQDARGQAAAGSVA